MCNQSSCGGNSCWIIIAIILLFLFCGNGNSCGNSCNCNCNNTCTPNCNPCC